MEAIPKHCGGPIPELQTTGTETTISVLNPDKKNICTEMFHDIPVRIVRSGKDAMFPVADIASGIGYDRSVLINLMSRNKENFDEYKGYVILTHPSGGPQEMVCLTRDGVIALVLALGLGHIKDPAKKQRIKEFRSWAVETIGKVMDGIPVQPRVVPEMTLKDAIDKYLPHIERIAQLVNAPPDEVRIVVLRAIERKTGEDMEPFRKLVARKPEPIIIQDIPKTLIYGPHPVRLATNDDALSHFIEDSCHMTGEVSKRALNDAYRFWCNLHRDEPLSAKRFHELLLNRSVREGRVGRHPGYIGISLNEKTYAALFRRCP